MYVCMYFGSTPKICVDTLCFGTWESCRTVLHLNPAYMFFSKKQGPLYRPQTQGLSIQGHPPKRNPPIHRNSFVERLPTARRGSPHLRPAFRRPRRPCRTLEGVTQYAWDLSLLGRPRVAIRCEVKWRRYRVGLGLL